MLKNYIFVIALLSGAQTVAAALLPNTSRSPIMVQAIHSLDDTSSSVDSRRAQAQQSTDKQPFPDAARIILVDQDGHEIDIGEVIFSASSEQKIVIKVEMDHSQFVDQFLSMRPFRCLVDTSEWFCYLPYPYQLKQTITPENLTDLEYSLLFIWKSPKDFGIDACIGVYYKLEREEDGTLRGQLMQGDLNVLANPPEPFSYPIDHNEFISDGANNRLYPSMIIR